MSATTDRPGKVQEVRKWRMRFSLRGLILATALICAVVSHVRTSLKLRETEQEATRLRNELGYLTITDANRVHAIAIGADESWAKKQWQWKLHLPEGRRFHICCMTSDLPQQGVPDYHPTLSDVQGDLKLTVSAVRDPKGEWKLVVNCDTGSEPDLSHRKSSVAGAKCTGKLERGWAALHRIGCSWQASSTSKIAAGKDVDDARWRCDRRSKTHGWNPGLGPGRGEAVTTQPAPFSLPLVSPSPGPAS
jgi:hypothetical protein